MSWFPGLVLAAVCGAQDPDELELLQQRVSQLETRLEEQERAQEEINELLLRALDATSMRLEQFLIAVQSGGLQEGEPEVEEPQAPEEEPDWAAALAVGGAAVGFVLLAWLWNVRSTAVVEGLVESPAEGDAVSEAGTVDGDDGVDPAGDGNGEVEPVDDLDVENVGVGLGITNVEAVELEEAREVRGGTPCRVQWRMACGDPRVGERLVREALEREPRVLVEPAPVVEAEGEGLRIGYHVHPELPVADRTQIAARLTEVLGRLDRGGRGIGEGGPF